MLGYIADVILAAAAIGSVSYLAYMFFFDAAAEDTAGIIAGMTGEGITAVPGEHVVASNMAEDVVDLTMADVYADMTSSAAETDPGIESLLPGK